MGFEVYDPWSHKGKSIRPGEVSFMAHGLCRLTTYDLKWLGVSESDRAVVVLVDLETAEIMIRRPDPGEEDLTFNIHPTKQKTTADLHLRSILRDLRVDPRSLRSHRAQITRSEDGTRGLRFSIPRAATATDSAFGPKGGLRVGVDREKAVGPRAEMPLNQDVIGEAEVTSRNLRDANSAGVRAAVRSLTRNARMPRPPVITIGPGLITGPPRDHYTEMMCSLCGADRPVNPVTGRRARRCRACGRIDCWENKAQETNRAEVEALTGQSMNPAPTAAQMLSGQAPVALAEPEEDDYEPDDA